MATFFGFLVIWIWLTAYAFGQYSMNLRLTPSTPTIRESGQVEIVCDVTTTLNNSMVEMVWIKKTGNGEGGGPGVEEKEIATNTKLSQEYRNNKRYQVSQDSNDKHHRFTLTITGLQASDSGEIGCQIPSNNIEIFQPLVVHVPVKSVRLSSKDLNNTHAIVYSDEQQVSFKEGVTRRFFCHVHGAYPEPRVRVLLGTRDITDRFQKTSSRIGSGASKEISYKVQLANQAFVITYDFSGQELKCIAEVNGQESTSASIWISLQGYRPQFECPSEVKVKLHQTNVEMRCDVSAQPEVSHAKFHWKRHTTGNESIEVGKGDGIYQGSFRSKPGEESSKEMVLRINQVFPQHFRAYFFEAENSEGKTIHTIELKRVGPKQRMSGTSCIFPTYASILSFVVFYAVLHQ